MSMIGNPIISTDFPKDTFSGTGSATAFTMSIAPASVNAVIVIVSGVVQDPSTYSISGTTLTFSAAPPSGTNNISVRHLGVAGIPNTPSAASVVTSSIAANAITPAKMANGGAEFGMRNRIINGAMVIDQRNAGASVTPTDGAYTLDRWKTGASAASKFSIQQNAGAVTPPVGFSNYLGVTSLSSYSVPAGEIFNISQPIEGFNFADLNWGTANAKTVTLSFQVRSSLTGTFGGSITNSAQNRSYPFSYSIPTANTWTTISLTITGDTSGTWIGATNGVGAYLWFGLGVGSTYSGTAGAWASALYRSCTGATSVVGTSGATFYITGVQLEVGSSATGFEYRQYGQELSLCQRYCISYSNAADANSRWFGYSYNGSSNLQSVQFPVTMRTSPSATFTTASAFTLYTQSGSSSISAISLDAASTKNANINATASSATGYGTIFAMNNTANQIIFSSEL